MHKPNFHKLERRHEILKHKIWPQKFPLEPRIKANGKKGKRKPFLIYQLTDGNRTLIESFHRELELQNYGLPRKNRLTEWVAILCQMLNKDFDQLTKEDVDQLRQTIAKKYPDTIEKDRTSTREGALTSLKQFGKWVHEDDPPKFLNSFKIPKKKSNDYTKEILTKQEIKEIIDHATNPLSKAIITCMYFSGARVSEIGLSRVKDFVFGGNECEFTMRYTKSNKIRKALMLGYPIPILKNWFETVHPLRDSEDYGNQPAFVSVAKATYGQLVTYDGLRKMIKVATQKAGITKPHNCHHFRHTFATHLYEDGFREYEIAELLGHTKGSRATAVYVNQSQSELFNKIRAKAHMENGEPEPKVNPADDVFNLKGGLAEHDRMKQMEHKIMVMEKLLDRFVKLDAVGKDLPELFATPNKK